ncbi:MAG: hypothetical protein LUC34_02560 [Campylobacter sp.]|nr:hypothetical protein [Campylobacter sp.]
MEKMVKILAAFGLITLLSGCAGTMFQSKEVAMGKSSYPSLAKEIFEETSVRGSVDSYPTFESNRIAVSEYMNDIYAFRGKSVKENIDTYISIEPKNKTQIAF